MTLHEAIEDVLIRAEKNLSAKEIADQINTDQLYQRKDGSLLNSAQIYARIANYKHLFELKPNKLVGFIDRELIPYKKLVTTLSHYLRGTLELSKLRVVLPAIIYVAWKKGANYDFSVFPLKNLRNTFISFLFNENEQTSNPLNEQEFNYLFQDLQENDFEIIFRIITDSHLGNISQKDFGSFFNEMVNEPIWREFKNQGSFTPKPLIDIISKLATVDRHSIISAFYAGNASQLVDLLNHNQDSNIFIHAKDNNPETVFIGTLNLLANGCTNFDYSSPVDFNQIGNNEYNCIISSPPFSGRLQYPFFLKYEGESLQTYDLLSASILSIVSQIKKSGRGFITVPISFLFRQDKSLSQIRRFLIDHHLLAGIISLPQGLFKPFSSISTALLVISSKRQGNSKLIYYDLSSVIPDNISNYAEELLILLNGDLLEKSKNPYRTLDNNTIEQHNYRLDKSLFFSHDNSSKPNLIELPNIGRRTLKSVISSSFSGVSVKPSNLNNYEGIPYIQVSDLSKNNGINELDLSQIKRFVSDTELISNPKYIPTNSVLISKVGLNLKPTIYRNRDQGLCSNNILVLKPDSFLLVEFLAAILKGENINQQVVLIRAGSGMPSFALSSLLSLYISVPSLEEQREYVTKFLSQQLKENTFVKEKSEEEDLYNIISRIKHELMQSVSSLGMDIRLIKSYLEQKEKDSDTISFLDPLITILAGMEKQTIDRSRLDSVINRMQKCYKDANETLIKAEETLRIGSSSFNPEEVSLRSYLKEDLLPLYENSPCNLNLIGDGYVIKGDKYQLKVLFKNLIDNAVKHSFDLKREKSENVINIHLNKMDQFTRFYEIVVENNGRPFLPGFDLSLFETRGSSNGKNKGTGFGGYHIKKVIENHQGMIRIARPEEVKYTEFKVKFIINLPE